jgi:hypothetical protein
MSLKLGTTMTYSYDEALAVIVGYAFGTTALSSSEDDPRTRARWGYRTYDCVPPADGTQLEPIDLLVGAGLNARLDVHTVASMITVSEEAGAALARVPLKFWDIPPGIRDDLIRRPPGDSQSPAAPLWDAWDAMKVKELNTARIHKVLHHKRPEHFPLVDGRTMELLGEDYWAVIHSDLLEGEAEFASLEGDFWSVAKDHGGWPRPRRLFRLRIHDILVWCEATPGERREAVREGERFIRGTGITPLMRERRGSLNLANREEGGKAPIDEAAPPRSAWRRMLNEIKLRRGCEDPRCAGYPEDCPRALSFDHGGMLKLFELSQAVKGSGRTGRFLRTGPSGIKTKERITWQLILAEIEKCDVVCKNCHEVRNSERDTQTDAVEGTSTIDGASNHR